MDRGQFKLKTPSLWHIKSTDWQYVYEPAEDTFLLLDALEKDIEYIRLREPKVCLELGCGSGVIITALSKVLNSISHCIAVDINKYACELTQKTASHNFVAVDIVQGDLASCFRNFAVDLVVFNPPYVPTLPDELHSKDCLTKSWAGGVNGREVIDRFLESVQNFLDPSGFGYLLLLKLNSPQDVMDVFSQKNFKSSVLAYRKLRGEELYIIKFQKSL